ncbi:hypothetical protein V6N12_054873 [Hibiscus sabdariffa]|uniref:RNase H type-1 domain-containing protein n=1 Tax=Hibiscus sabdariffa TaxID=183260 RepID=A0ABR2D2K0_9ROSI
MAACGGVGRDSELKWCFGFAKDIGSCSCLEVEFWGIYEGLATAWSLGYSHVILETDSREAYDTIVSRNDAANAIERLVRSGSLEYRCWLDAPIAVCDRLVVDGEHSAPLATVDASRDLVTRRELMSTLFLQLGFE